MSSEATSPARIGYCTAWRDVWTTYTPAPLLKILTVATAIHRHQLPHGSNRSRSSCDTRDEACLHCVESLRYWPVGLACCRPSGMDIYTAALMDDHSQLSHILLGKPGAAHCGRFPTRPRRKHPGSRRFGIAFHAGPLLSELGFLSYTTRVFEMHVVRRRSKVLRRITALKSRRTAEVQVTGLEGTVARVWPITGGGPSVGALNISTSKPHVVGQSWVRRGDGYPPASSNFSRRAKMGSKFPTRLRLLLLKIGRALAEHTYSSARSAHEST